MDLSTYEEITGRTVADSKRNIVSAQIERTRTILESMLGYTLDPDLVDLNLYNGVDEDDVVGAYRLFPYSPSYLNVDPFSAVHAVKLVQGDEIIDTLDTSSYAVSYFGRGLSKQLKVVGLTRSGILWYQWPSLLTRDILPSEELQLAVDADWLWTETDELPQDLLSVWADMVTYHSDSKSNIKSQTVLAHSYTKFEKVLPEEEPRNVAILERYAGPHGLLGRPLVA